MLDSVVRLLQTKLPGWYGRCTTINHSLPGRTPWGSVRFQTAQARQTAVGWGE